MNENQHKKYFYPSNFGHERTTTHRRETMSIYNKKQERFCSVQIVIERYKEDNNYKTYTIENSCEGARKFGHGTFETSHECMAHHYTKVANLIKG